MGTDAGAEILWDEWGVPHIFADDLPSLFHAFGWAQMQAHGDLILRLFGQARGRAAEYWGEAYLPSDQLTRTMSIPQRGDAWLDAQPDDFRGYLIAFVHGMNAYAEAHPERLDEDARAALPIAPSDVLAHLQRMFFTFLTLNGQRAKPGEPLRLISEGIPGIPGSNGWAIGPAYSRSGHSLLLANPHLPWDDVYVWFEAQLQAPGLDIYGVTLVGGPVLTIAFNDYLGWTHTVNTHKGWDAYLLTPDTAGTGYLFDGETRPFETERQTVRVRAEDGSLRDEELLVRRSIHGPVIAEVEGRPVVLRVVGLDPAPSASMLEQWWEMGTATNLGEFEAALRRMQAPMFTLIYADRDGHILSLFEGLVPKRPGGDWDDWAGLIPGDTSDTLWTEVHPYEDLPRVVDPPAGWVQNSNSSPWTTTLPPALDPADFPPYLAPQRMGTREQRAVRMLIERGPLSFDDLLACAASTRLELADRLLDDLIAAARECGSELAHEAADILAGWDRATEAESRGAALFALWVLTMLPSPSVPSSTLFAVPWSLSAPLETPSGLADPAAAVTALEAAAETLRLVAGSLDVPWGEVWRLRRGDIDLPGNGGRDPLGAFRVLWCLPQEDGRFASVGGTSYVAAVEFSTPLRARALLAYGNASQPGSPHNGDQLALYANKEMRPVWRDRAEIEAHLESRERIKPT